MLFILSDSRGCKSWNRPFGPCSLVASGSLGGSGMLQSVPAQVASQVHVASLLHTCTDQIKIHCVWTLTKYIYWSTVGRYNFKMFLFDFLLFYYISQDKNCTFTPIYLLNVMLITCCITDKVRHSWFNLFSVDRRWFWSWKVHTRQHLVEVRLYSHSKNIF